MVVFYNCLMFILSWWRRTLGVVISLLSCLRIQVVTASISHVWVFLVILLCLFGAVGLVGVECSLWTEFPPVWFLDPLFRDVVFS